MVCKDQPLGTNDPAGTASAKDDDRILDRWFIDMVKLVLGQLQTFLHHVIIYLLTQQKRQPHSFICNRTEEKGNCQYNRQKKLLHLYIVFGQQTYLKVMSYEL